MDLRQAAAQLDGIATGLREKAVVDLRGEGMTFREIAAALGISPARAHQLYRSASERKRAS